MSDNDDGEVMSVLPFDDGSMGRVIRKTWHDGRWFFSVINVVAVLTDSANPRNYWNMLKSRLDEEGARETYTKCVQSRG